MSKRIEWLDALRGLAAVGVVLYHYHGFLGARHTGYGFVAVDVFFALSGVVLALRYTAAIEGDMTFRAFAGARLRRLYPMVLIAGLLVGLMNAFAIPAGVYALATSDSAWAILAVWPGNADGGSAFPQDSPMWSLWAELVANVVWFFAIRWFGRRSMAWMGIVMMGVLVVAAWQCGTLNIGWQSGLVDRVWSLVRALAWFSVGYGIAMAGFRSLRWSCAVFAALVLTAVTVVHGAPTQAWLHQVVVAAAGVSLLQVLYLLDGPPRSLGALARWLGMASFPLYMIHAPMGRLLPMLGGHLSPGWTFLVLMGGATLAATVLNEVLVAYVQQRYRAWRLRTLRIGEST
jgi:peptidoglycan/LPS O-acetylase OafA/YrhL